MIRALLVDDEEPARHRLRSMLAAFKDVQVVGEAVDGEEALGRIVRDRPDLVFLDIQMPGRNGMEVIAAIPPPRPRIIFCTAFDQYAVDAFEHHAVDYLLKPVNRGRLARSIERVRLSMDGGGQIERDLIEASATQERLLPRDLPRSRTLDYGGACRAARGVAGDYYDFLALDDRRLAIVQADVSGKGLFAGLLMAALQARIQSLAPSLGGKPAELISELNRVMLATTEENRYATLFYGVYDDATRSLTYVNAGHEPPLLISGSTARLQSTGTVVGLMPGAEYTEVTRVLAPGDLLIAPTDGITEAANEEGEPFGAHRLEAVGVRNRKTDAADLMKIVLGEVDRFRGTAPQEDDMTLVVARVR